MPYPHSPSGLIHRRVRSERTFSPGPGQVRADDQPQDRESARPRRAADAARPGRRGDRVNHARWFAALDESGSGSLLEYAGVLCLELAEANFFTHALVPRS